MYEKLPHEEDVEDIAKKIRANRNNLDSYTIDDLILLISTATEKVVKKIKSNIVKTARSSFLYNWCSYRTLSRALQISLYEKPYSHR